VLLEPNYLIYERKLIGKHNNGSRINIGCKSNMTRFEVDFVQDVSEQKALYKFFLKIFTDLVIDCLVFGDPSASVASVG
jgi:hypothetical protein